MVDAYLIGEMLQVALSVFCADHVELFFICINVYKERAKTQFVFV